MRIVKMSLLAVMLFSISGGLAYGQKVTTDYDKKADFSHYKTYMWVAPAKLSNPLMSQRVMDDVNAQLTAKGWTMVTENADAAVMVNGATKDQQTLDTFYSGYPGWRWGWGGTMATTTVEHYRVGTLVVDILDARSKQAMFRGVATDTLSDKPEKNEEKLNKSVEKIFKSFPPEPKS